MEELINHPAYRLLTDRYERVGLDYVILASYEVYAGIETHRKAIARALELLNGRFSEYGFGVDFRADHLSATPVDPKDFLDAPDGAEPYAKERSFTPPAPLPYWYAFLMPPQGTPYLAADFRFFNETLFPNPDETEVYRWNDDFSSYFDAGKEWWGTGFWTAYDPKTGVFAVIGASLTD